MDGTGRQVITIYGRQPVMEALDAPDVDVEQVLIASGLRGGPIDEIVDRAERVGAPVKRVAASKVTRISGNGRHDQGVVADVVAPGLGELDEWLAGPACAAAATVVLLDGVTNPGNVGMIVRTVTAAGL